MYFSRLTTLFFLSFLLFFSSTDKVYSENSDNKVKFKVINLQNKKFTNNSFKNITILHFGNLDSSSFIKDFLDLKTFQENKKYNFSYVPIMYNTKEDIILFKSRYNISNEIYMDKKNYTKESVSLQFIPSIYILDQKGYILFQYSGALNLELLDKNLESLNNMKDGEI